MLPGNRTEIILAGQKETSVRVGQRAVELTAGADRERMCFGGLGQAFEGTW